MSLGKFFAAGLLAAALAVSVQATPVAPGGQTATLDHTATIFAGDLQLASLAGVYDNGLEKGNYRVSVFRTSGGLLDFVYAFDNLWGTSAVRSVTMSSFAGFTTDLWYLDAAGTPPNQTGVVADRDVSGATVKFYYNPTGVAPGATAATLVIRTNATNYKAGLFSVQDGATTTVAAFAPAAVPEPISYVLMGSGLIALGLLKRKLA